MIGEVVHTPAGAYVRCAPHDGMLAGEVDLLDLLAGCYDLGSNRVLLDEEHLPPEFFDLKSGLAGAIFHKLSTYHAKAAIVVDMDGIQNQRFRELIYECNKGDEIHFFDNVAQAERWLAAS